MQTTLRLDRTVTPYRSHLFILLGHAELFFINNIFAPIVYVHVPKCLARLDGSLAGRSAHSPIDNNIIISANHLSSFCSTTNHRDEDATTRASDSRHEEHTASAQECGKTTSSTLSRCWPMYSRAQQHNLEFSINPSCQPMDHLGHLNAVCQCGSSSRLSVYGAHYIEPKVVALQIELHAVTKNDA